MVRVMKNKGGRTGAVDVHFEPQHYHFSDSQTEVEVEPETLTQLKDVMDTFQGKIVGKERNNMSEIKQGKNKRYGRNKVKCTKYFNELRLGKNKLARFIKNNVGKDWTDEQKNQAISNFKDLHYKKHLAHNLAK